MRKIINSIDEKLFVCDHRGKVTFANRALIEASGKSEGDVTGMGAEGLIVSCTGATDLESLDFGTVFEGKALEKRYDILSEGGFRTVFDIKATPVLDERGKVTAAAVILKETTEVVKLEEILERYAEGLTVLYEISNAFLTQNAMAEALPNALDMLRSYYSADVVQLSTPVINGAEDRLELLCISGASAGTSGIISVAPDSIEGRCLVDKCPVVVPDFAKSATVRRAEFIDQGKVKSGLGVPMVVDGKVLGILSILYYAPRYIDTAELWYLNVATNTLAVYIEKERSLTKLQESENFLNSVLEGIGEGVVVMDHEFRILTANKGYLDSVNKKLGDVLGKHCYECSHGLDSPCYEHGEVCSVKHVFETGRPHGNLYTHSDEKGRMISLQISSYPIFNPAGEVFAVVETLMDITGRVKLEKDLEKRVNELEEFYDMAVGRELRMMELKEDLSLLREELARYKGQ